MPTSRLIERKGIIMLKMKRQFKRIIAAALIFIMLIGMAGCSAQGAPEASGDKKTAYKLKTDGEDYCRINGTNIYFIPDEVLQPLKAPLAKLLSNVLLPNYSKGMDDEPYRPSTDPNAPAIMDGYWFALFDVTGDGMPELMVDVGGGSSGATLYYAYDIPTGKKVGSVAANKDEWCYYYGLEGGVYPIAATTARIGWQGRKTFIMTIGYSEKLQEYDDEVLFETYHAIDTPPDDEDPNPDGDDIYLDEWVEIYPDTEYYISGQKVYLDNYLSELERFHNSYIRIPETQMKVLKWKDVSDEDDDYVTRGAKMAEALLALDQKFIAMEPDNAETP